MLRVGLTGGIACGKSHVLTRLAAAGCRTLDLDRVAHEVMSPGEVAYDEVVTAFGPGVLAADGTIDRRVLGAQVFADPAALARLNAIVHSRARAEEARWLRMWGDQRGAVAVVDGALLIEAGVHLRFDRLVVVHCAPEEQLRRLMARDCLSREAAALRVGAQMPVAEKRRFAHLELDTSSSSDDTDAQADALAATLFALAQTPVEPRVAPRAALAELLRTNARSALDLQAAARFLDDVVEAKGIEMLRVQALAGRRSHEQWLSAPGDALRVGPTALMPPVAAWCLARRGLDDELLGLAALSVARALTAEPQLLGKACAAAWWASRELSRPGGEPRAREEARGFARRWSCEAGDRLEPEVDGPEATAAVSTADLFPPIDRFLTAARAWIEGEAVS